MSTGRLADVLAGACAVLGVPGTTDRLGFAQRLGGVRKIAVLLVDGLGYHLLGRAAPHAPVLSDFVEGRLGSVEELDCGFPSTTPTSITTLGTGSLPGEHGVLGFTVNIPGTDRVLTHVLWRGDPAPRAWQPVPPLLERAAAAGVRCVLVTRPEFAGSGLTLAAYGAVPLVPAQDHDQLVERMLAELSTAPGAAGLVYGYHPTLDTMAHAHGIDSAQWRAEVTAVDRMLARLVDGLPRDAALLVTADHGAIDVPLHGRVDIAADPRLSAGVRVVAGEARVRYLHACPGAAGDVLDTWRGVLGARASVLSRDDAIARGLFGTVSPTNAQRIGDVVVICEGENVVLASDHEPEAVGKLVGFHGALTPEETAVPLLGLRAP